MKYIQSQIISEQNIRIAQLEAEIALERTARQQYESLLHKQAESILNLLRELANAQKDGTCNWEYEEHEHYFWIGECGITWYFEEGTPSENEVNFCPKCGKKLVEFVTVPMQKDKE